MDDDTRKTELARRAVNSKPWRWMSGMRDLESGFLLADDYQGDPWRWVVDDDVAVIDREGAAFAPDLDDPATLGCLLALVREAHRRPALGCLSVGAWWRVGDTLGWVAPTASTEAEALVAALESAP